MLDVIFGYMGVIVGLVLILYPLYELLSIGINKYILSVTGGEVDVNLPYSALIRNFIDLHQPIEDTRFFCTSVYAFIIGIMLVCIVDYGAQETALCVLEHLYIAGTYAGLLTLAIVILVFSHKGLKKAYKISKKIKDL